MVDYEIKYFGWFSGLTDKGNPSDKVWGWVEIEHKIYNFWGKRGGKFQWQRHEGNWSSLDLESLAIKKTKKGYNQIPTDNIEKCYPNFHTEFKKQLFNARMMGKIRDEGF